MSNKNFMRNTKIFSLYCTRVLSSGGSFLKRIKVYFHLSFTGKLAFYVMRIP
jgi:hypothetical protein